MKQVIQLDTAGYFTGLTVADESPLEPGVFLIPAGAVEAPVPVVPVGKLAKWNGTWVFEDPPQPEIEVEPDPVPLTPDELRRQVKDQRRSAYAQESDPLFFKSQRGEATVEEWQAKIVEIKERFPDQ